MTTYSHTQRGTLIQGLFFPLTLVFPCLWIFTKLPSSGVMVLVIVEMVIVFAIALFHSLTVSVDENYLRIKFGIGLIKTSFRIAEITNATRVQNHWYDGWGIRLLNNGYLYNVSGLSAVEFSLSSGAVHRIGTDEPEALTQAINNARLASV